jgi:hypothetical protein
MSPTLVLKGTAEELASPRALKVRYCVQVDYPRLSYPILDCPILDYPNYGVEDKALPGHWQKKHEMMDTHNFHVFIRYLILILGPCCRRIRFGPHFSRDR